MFQFDAIFPCGLTLWWNEVCLCHQNNQWNSKQKNQTPEHCHFEVLEITFWLYHSHSDLVNVRRIIQLFDIFTKLPLFYSILFEVNSMRKEPTRLICSCQNAHRWYHILLQWLHQAGGNKVWGFFFRWTDSSSLVSNLQIIFLLFSENFLPAAARK